MCIRQVICSQMRLQALVTGIFALAWWGILYPELCFTQDTCQQIVIENGEEKVVEETDYRDILAAGEDEIVIKSRLVEWLEEQEWFQPVR